MFDVEEGAPSTKPSSIKGAQDEEEPNSDEESDSKENAVPEKFYKTRDTKYVGVSWHSGRRTWRAKISHKKKIIEIGEFSTAKAAAKAWDAVNSVSLNDS